MQTDSLIPNTSEDGQINKRLSVLVLEDDTHLNYIIMHKLKERDCIPYLAKNAQEAMAILESGKSIDVLWLDIHLPGMSGLEFLAEVRAKEKFSHIKAFVISASGGPAMQAEATRLGVVEYLEKGNHSLDEVIKRIMGGV